MAMVHAFPYFDGMTATIPTDNLKTVVVEGVEGHSRFHPKMLDFASYYGFLHCTSPLAASEGRASQSREVAGDRECAVLLSFREASCSMIEIVRNHLRLTITRSLAKGG